MSEGGLFVEVLCVGWVEGGDGVVVVVCVCVCGQCAGWEEGTWDVCVVSWMFAG